MVVKFVIADQNAVSAEGHFRNYTDALALAAQSLGCDVTVLWNKRFSLGEHSASYRMKTVFSCTEAEAAARRLIAYGEGHFGFELDGALRSLGLGAQDHVVIHTCHFVELVEALDYLATLPPARDLPTFHIVVRYDPDIYRYRMHKLMRRLGAILRTPHLEERLRLHSDTRQLASEFTKLLGTKVEVCPIPVDLDGLLPALATTEGLSPGRPLIATYLGTARSEKGYADILEAIAFLQKDYVSTDRLHFVLQCSERSIGGEPGLADYQRKLESFIAENDLHGKIRLVRHIVEQQEYCALVARSDIVLLAYSPESYRYRSSGVLIEAMAAGKVVVTREGSWMASRVSPDSAICYADPAGLGPALAQAVERFDDLDRGAKALQAEAVTSGDPITLARHFLQSGVPAGGLGAGALVLTIGQGDEIAAGALRASVFLNRLACLTGAGYRVVVLLLASAAAKDFESRRRIADALRPYPLESVSVLLPSEVGQMRGVERPAAIYLGEGVDAGLVEQLGLAGTPLLSEVERAGPTGAGSTEHLAYPFSFRPVGVEQLAGPVDGLELLASADPLREDLRIDNRSLARTQSRYDALLRLNSLDILLHCPGARSARWFFEEVYTRFLADHQVRVLVIGDTDADLEADGFLSLGPVANREPLYAAAKIVVASASPEDGAPLAVFEALARAKPALFFGVAARGLEQEGIEVHDAAADLAAAIMDLLGSPQKRERATSLSHRAAETLGAGAVEEAIVARLASAGVAPAAGVSPKASSEAAHIVEWSPAVRAANLLIRSCLADEPLDCRSELVAASNGAELVTRLSEALIGQRQAPLLTVDGGLLARVMRRQSSGGAKEAIRLARIAIDAARPAHEGDGASAFAVNRQLPADILLAGAPERSEEHSGATVRRLCDEGGTGPELVSIDVTENMRRSKFTVWQDIPLISDARVFGRPVFANWSFDGRGPMVRGNAPSAGAGSRMAQGIGLRVKSLLNGWAPWTTANQLFDDQWYLAAYPEAAHSGVEPFRHYERCGAARGYRPNPYFDPGWYAARYGLGAAEAWQHYLQFGHDPQFDPGPHFSASLYREANPDVATSWKWSPLLHYSLLGQSEGREIYPAEPQRPFQSLILPVVIGVGGEHWIELMLDETPGDRSPIVLHVGEIELDIAVNIDPAGMVARARLPGEAVVSGIVHLRVGLEAGERPVGVRKLRAGWTFVG